MGTQIKPGSPSGAVWGGVQDAGNFADADVVDDCSLACSLTHVWALLRFHMRITASLHPSLSHIHICRTTACIGYIVVIVAGIKQSRYLLLVLISAN